MLPTIVYFDNWYLSQTKWEIKKVLLINIQRPILIHMSCCIFRWYFDHGPTINAHLQSLETNWSTLKEANINLSSSITYLKHKIDSKRLHPVLERYILLCMEPSCLNNWKCTSHMTRSSCQIYKLLQKDCIPQYTKAYMLFQFLYVLFFIYGPVDVSAKSLWMVASSDVWLFQHK